MGYMRHHAIIVTGFFQDEMEGLHKKAEEIFEGTQVSPLMPSGCNGYLSFFIAPDGSKEGWETSDNGDMNRDSLINYLSGLGYCVDWVEVQYGDDDGNTLIVRDSDESHRIQDSSEYRG